MSSGSVVDPGSADALFGYVVVGYVLVVVCVGLAWRLRVCVASCMFTSYEVGGDFVVLELEYNSCFCLLRSRMDSHSHMPVSPSSPREAVSVHLHLHPRHYHYHSPPLPSYPLTLSYSPLPPSYPPPRYITSSQSIPYYRATVSIQSRTFPSKF